MAALPLSTRKNFTRLMPSSRAAYVTVNPNAGNTSSRSVSPGGGMVVIARPRQLLGLEGYGELNFVYPNTVLIFFIKPTVVNL